MIFLRDNALLERELTFDDIKPRLLGTFATLFNGRSPEKLTRLLQATGGHVPV